MGIRLKPRKPEFAGRAPLADTGVQGAMAILPVSSPGGILLGSVLQPLPVVVLTGGRACLTLQGAFSYCACQVMALPSASLPEARMCLWWGTELSLPTASTPAVPSWASAPAGPQEVAQKPPWALPTNEPEGSSSLCRFLETPAVGDREGHFWLPQGSWTDTAI